MVSFLFCIRFRLSSCLSVQCWLWLCVTAMNHEQHSAFIQGYYILEASNMQKKFLLLSKHMTLDFIFSTICYAVTSHFPSAELEYRNSVTTAHFPQTFLRFFCQSLESQLDSMICRVFSNISDSVILKPLSEVTSSSLHFQHHPTLLLSEPGWGLPQWPEAKLWHRCPVELN